MASIAALKDVHTQLKTRMEKTVGDFRANLLSTRTGRASVHMLDQVKVDYYGTDTPISQVAQISTPEAQLILVSPWEMTMVAPIEKAIRTSNLGFNPMHDGKVIRVPVPPMNEERRKEAVKHLAAVLEVHGVTRLLTFNGADFKRFPGLAAMHRQDVQEQGAIL